jgi:uncharacterized protein YbjT (DUF2867 family)
MYVVAGATGNTGGVVAESLLQQGKPVTVIVRSEEKGQRWKSKGAKIALGSVEDSEALAQILKGADGAYLLIPPNLEATDLLEDRKRVAFALAQAVRDSGTAHVVFLSSIGAQHASGTGPIISTHVGETALASAAKNVTFVRAGYFFENWASVLGAVQGNGVLPTFLTPDRKIPMVATRDIGRIAAEALLDPARGPRIIELAGPQDYSPEDIAVVLSSLLNREVRVQHIPLSAAVPTFQSFGFAENTARLFAEMYEGINSGHVAYEGGSAEFRRGSVTAEEVLRGLLGQSAQAQAGA